MTGSDTDIRQKTRAVFLAFIMVTSVFGATVALSGSATADNHIDTTVYVDDDTGDHDDSAAIGTIDNPYDNIQNAIDDAADGDTGSDDSIADGDNVRIIVQNGSETTDTYSESLTFDDTRSGEIELTTQNGSSAVAVNGSASPAASISAQVNTTFDGLTLQASGGQNVVVDDAGSDHETTIRDSTVEVDEGAVGVSSETTINIIDSEISDPDGDDSDDGGFGVRITKNYGPVNANNSQITGTTFDSLDVGAQITDASGVTVSNNEFNTINAEAVIFGARTATVTSASVTQNNFTDVGQGVYFIENGDTFTNTSAEGFYVAKNNFGDNGNGYDAGGNFAIGADGANNYDGTGGAIDGTIVAEENYYGTAAGPTVASGDSARDQSNFVTQGSLIDDDDSGDIVYGPWLDAPYPNQDETLNFDNSFAVDQQNTDDKTVVNVTLPAAGGEDVNESSVDVLLNNNDGNNDAIKVVENGELQQDALSAGQNEITVVESTLDGSNDSVEYIRLNVSLKEDTSGYDLVANATDTASSPNEVTDSNARSSPGITTFTAGDGTVDMTGQQLKLTPDSSNPFVLNDDGTTSANEAGDLKVLVADQFGNNLTDTSSAGISGADDLALTTSDDSVTISGPFDAQSGTNSQTKVPVENSNPAFFNVTNSEAETVTLEVLDVGSTDPTLTRDTVDQTFSPRIGGLAASVDRTTLPADGSTEAQISAQLTDGNGNAVPRAGETVSFSIDNSSDAGVSRVAGPTTTNNNGVATLNITADTSGVTLDITAVDQSTSNGYTAATSLETVPGNIDTAASTFELNNLGADTDLAKSAGVQVATEHDLTVTLVDDQGNAVPGVPVEFSANKSGATFGSASTTTNDTGVATTTVTLPEEKGTTRLNVSAGDFNASALGSASINATTNAANTSRLQFAEDQQSTFAVDSSGNTVTIEAADQFGNINESATSTVTLTSADDTVFDFGGSASTTASFSNGVATVSNLNAGSSAGSADIEATIPDSDIANTTLTFSVSEPQSIDITFSSDVSTSSNSDTNQTATVTAQLIGPDGSDIGVENEQISFARQNGDAAELDQSANDFSVKTDSNGQATFQVNATDTTGDTTFLAIADNSSSQGTGTITTTGAATTVNVAPASSTVASGNETTVTATFEDSEGRTVPRTGTDITLQASNGQVDGSTSSSNATQLVNGVAQATFTYNATDVSSGTDVTLTAVGGSVTGETTVTVGETAGEQPTDAEERALQAANVNDASQISQNDITRVITLRDRGEQANGVNVSQNDITTLITLRDRAQ